MKAVFYFLCALFSAGFIHAQTHIPSSALISAGAGAEESNGVSVNWSFGKVMAIPESGYDNARRPKEEILLESSAVLEVAPNPTTERFTLTLTTDEEKLFRFRLIDLNGKLLTTGIIEDKSVRISLKDFPSGIYILHVFDEQAALGQVRILKTAE